MIGRRTFILLIALLAFSSIVFAEEGRGEYDYILGIHFSSVGGKSSSYYYDLVKSITMITEDKYGYKVRVEKFAKNEDLEAAFVNKEIDGGLLFPVNIIRIEEMGGEVAPWATYVIGGKRKAAFCYWENKHSMVGSIDDIGSKKLLIVDYDFVSYILMREALKKHGIDKPIYQVFDTFLKVPNTNSAFFAMAKSGEGVLWANADYKYLNKLFIPQIQSDVVPSYCTDQVYTRGLFAINKLTIKGDKLEEAFGYMGDAVKRIDEFAKEYPQIQAAYGYAKMAKMKFILAVEHEIKYDRAVYEKAKANGWLDEAEFFLSEINKAQAGKDFQVKPDMAYCKKVCGDKGAECVLECIQ